MACPTTCAHLQSSPDKNKHKNQSIDTVLPKGNGKGKGKPQSRPKAADASSSARGAARWRVQVLCEGVGGFAVGVAAKRAYYPFKSLGNRPDTWVLHSSGLLLHNRKQTALPIQGREDGGERKGEREEGEAVVCEYGMGDVVEVEVETHQGEGAGAGAAGKLWFRVMSKRESETPRKTGESSVRVGPVLLPAGEYVLCCQPYMGGGARLLS